MAFNDHEIDVMSETVDEGGDAGGIGKDGVPVFEDAIGGDQNRATFVTAIDDFEKQVGGAGVVREIANFVDAEDLGAGIEGELTTAECGRVTLQVSEQFWGGAEDDGVTSEDGRVSNVFDEHGFAEAIGAEQDEVAGFGDEVEGQSALDEGAVDLFRPKPIEVGEWFEAAQAGQAQAAFETAPGLVAYFRRRDLFEQGVR